MIQISVIIETFTGETESDISLREVYGAHGVQDYPPDQVEYLIVTADDTPELRALIAATFGPVQASVRIIATGSADYNKAKLRGRQSARGRVIAFADSDVIVPPRWLRSIHDAVLTEGHAVVLGPTSFKPGSVLRVAFNMADFGSSSVDGQRYVRNLNANNVAFRRELLEQLSLDPEGKYNRFGGSSSIATQLRAKNIPILLVPAMRAYHGFSWTVWLYEKRLRRYAHIAYMKRHDPNCTLRAATGIPERPLTWLPAWWRFARLYQTWPARCRKTLGLGLVQRALQRVLLAGISAWEFLLIVYVGLVPGALRRVAAATIWWPTDTPVRAGA